MNGVTHLKKIISLILLAALSLSLFSCKLDIDQAKDDNDELPGSDFKMTAIITELGEKITVDVIKSEYTSGIHLVITSDKTDFRGKDGSPIKRSDLKVGDTVEILYSGQVMMSLPPQIVAAKITVI